MYARSGARLEGCLGGTGVVLRRRKLDACECGWALTNDIGVGVVLCAFKAGNELFGGLWVN